MIISNIRDPTDLENKRRLQQQLIELEIANETELERRVRDYKDPNKALPVAPQTKSNAELRKDRIENERQAIKHMEDLGFDYSRGAELVAWLSGSEVDKLADFNANFKGIKKELSETTNPKLLTTEYLKNYLERYFEDLDVSYGRKFAQQTQRETQEALSVDELIQNVPSPDMLDELKQRLIAIQSSLRTDAGVLTQQISAIDENLSGETDAGQIRAFQRERDAREKARDIVRKTAQKGYLLIALVDLYKALIPSPDFFNTLKLGLPIQERTDLVRRYGRLFQKIKALSSVGAEELIDEAQNAGDLRLRQLLYGKMEKALGFLTNKGVDLITSLNRNYESELAKQGKEVELEKIKRYNDIQAKAKQEAEEAIQQYLRHPFVDDSIRGESKIADDTFIRNAIGRFRDGTYANEIEAQIDPAEKAREDELVADRAEAFRQIAEAEAQRIAEIEARRRALIASVAQAGLPKIQAEQAKEQAEELARLKDERRTEMIAYYRAFINEIYSLGSEKAQILTFRNFLDKLGVDYSAVKLSDRPKADISKDLRQVLERWILENRINPVLTGTLPIDYDIDGSRGRPLEKADIYSSAGNTTSTTIRGVGLKKALKSHFKDDEAELMSMAKALKKHSKHEKKIDSMFQRNESSSDEEQGGALGFRHRRIKVGKGITLKEKQPNYRTFGKYVIHMGHLIDKNIANFKYPSLGSIPSIKPLNISDDYKEFILDTMENEKPNERVLRKLPIDEQKHFERVVVGAGLMETFRLRKNGDADEKKEVDRFNLLRGEVLAGNNNEKVIKELKGLIVKLINDGRIRRQDGLNMLMELSVI